MRSAYRGVLLCVAIIFVSVLLNAASAQVVKIGGGYNKKGFDANFSVTLVTQNETVSSIQNDIAFSSATPIRAGTDGRPMCTVNPSLGKNDTVFTFLPLGCSGSACTGIRAVVISMSDRSTIPDGYLLYTCTVHIESGAATGVYPLVGTNGVVAAPSGVHLPETTVEDGFIVAQGSVGC